MRSAIPGSAATFVRGFRAVYLGLFFNCVIMATVNLAAAKIGNVVLGWPMGRTLFVCAVITIFFAGESDCGACSSPTRSSSASR